MNRRALRSVWPLLAVFVFGSLVLPAAHRAWHHAAQSATEEGAPLAPGDDACPLCAATFAAIGPSAHVLLVAHGVVGLTVDAPRDEGVPSPPATPSRAPPAG